MSPLLGYHSPSFCSELAPTVLTTAPCLYLGMRPKEILGALVKAVQRVWPGYPRSHGGCGCMVLGFSFGFVELRSSSQCC